MSVCSPKQQRASTSNEVECVWYNMSNKYKMKPNRKVSTSSPKKIKIRRQSKLFLAAITEEFKLTRNLNLVWQHVLRRFRQISSETLVGSNCRERQSKLPVYHHPCLRRHWQLSCMISKWQLYASLVQDQMQGLANREQMMNILQKQPFSWSHRRFSRYEAVESGDQICCWLMLSMCALCLGVCGDNSCYKQICWIMFWVLFETPYQADLEVCYSEYTIQYHRGVRFGPTEYLFPCFVYIKWHMIGRWVVAIVHRPIICHLM